MINYRISLLLLLFFGPTGLFSVYAASPEITEQPLTIHSQQAEFNERTGYALYSGGVSIQHGPISIEAHEVTISTDEHGEQKAVATGVPAEVSQLGNTPDTNMTAKALTITYLVNDKLLLLERAAYLIQQGKTFTGDTIRYDLSSQKVVASGNEHEQVKLVIPAEQLTSPKSEAHHDQTK